MSGAPYEIQTERNPPALVAHLLKERRDRLEERAKTFGYQPDPPQDQRWTNVSVL